MLAGAVAALAGPPAAHAAFRCRREDVDRTTTHRDHVHVGFSRAGAAARTTFWLAARARR